MTRRTGYFVAALAMFAPALAAQAPSATQAGQVVVPDNPAGRALKSWLDAFNSGDAAKLNAYYQRYEPAKSADDVMGFRDATGGFELLSVEKSQPLHVEFLVKEKKGDTRAFGAFDVSPGESGAVKHFTLLAIPPGASVADFKIDGAERTRVIDGAIAKLVESYVFPETAKKMGDSVRARLKRGEYDAVTNGATFAGMLTEDFQDLITRYAWGDVWSRPGLDPRIRSCITVAMAVALNRPEELALHLHGALRNGVTVDELREVLLQTAIYCGVPAANSAFRVAQDVLGDLPAT